MANYYDFVLGFIPLVLLGVGGGLHVAGLTLTTALTIGGIVAIGLVVHALFVRAPVDGPVRSAGVETVDGTGTGVSISD